MSKLNLDYSVLPSLVGGIGMNDKELSRQFLIWFLQNYYRLEETEAADCVSDERYDKGIDGIYVNEHLTRIDIFSSTIATKPNKWVSETKVKEFVGSLAQFRSSSAVKRLQSDTTNKDLKRILINQEIAKKIEDGYRIYGIYVTNATSETQTLQYLAHVPNEVTLYDSTKLKNEYVPLDITPPIAKPITFDTSTVPTMRYEIDKDLTMVIAPVLASDLVQMDGIVNNELFAPNVRFWLGRNTPVNKAIEESIKDESEHKYFAAFHNGLIVLCEKLNDGKNGITISDYHVVNGCQSLKGLYENRDFLTPDLRIFTKFFVISPKNKLATKITNRTNNQNGSKPRDFQSNSEIQNRLQAEIHQKYKGEIYYRIRRGEHPEWKSEKVIENELAGKLILAFDLKKPNECNSNVFTDEKHREIFGNPLITADRIIVLHDILKSGESARSKMDNRLFANYALTRFFLLFLIRGVLEIDKTGKEFIENPSHFLSQFKGRKRLQYCFKELSELLCETLNIEVGMITEEEDYFDYKTRLKNPKSVHSLSTILLSRYKREIRNPRYGLPFSQLWINSEKEV